jgi:hypothetical protein
LLETGEKLREPDAPGLAPAYAEVVYDPDTAAIAFEGGRKFDQESGMVALIHRLVTLERSSTEAIGRS